LFPPEAPWNQSIARAALASDSAAVIGFLEQRHSSPTRFRVDFSFTLLTAGGATPRVPFKPTVDHYAPDCDRTPIPIVADGRIEGERGYACAGNGDCHLLVVDPGTCRLYEMWRANIVRNEFSGGCLAVWDLRQTYGSGERGQQCSSSDAAGLPIAPLLFTADELEQGEIAHALRFVLPNELIRHRAYVNPATHATHEAQGGASAPPYGARLRLRAGTDLNRFKPAAKVVARALMNYGMFLADGGNVTFMALDDEHSIARYNEIGFSAGDLQSLRWSDFEVVAAGPARAWTGKCERTPITE
jgi:serine/threonine-protein kinase